MLCLSGFELYSRWVPLIVLKNIVKKLKIAKIVKNWYEIIIRNQK